MKAVVAENIWFSYRGNGYVLKNISFSIEHGEIVALLGPNGSGKTTLLKIINGLLKPSRGRISVYGMDPQRAGRRVLARTIAWLPQEPTTPFPYTVLEYVLMGRAPYVPMLGTPGEKDVERAMDVLRELGLDGYADKPITELSGGEKQLVVLARALAQEPRMLLLDEPTSHLDIGHRALVYRIIKRLRGRLTILFTTHDPNEAMYLADKTLLLNGGEVKAFGETKQIVTGEMLSRIYGVEITVVEHNGYRVIVPRI